MLVYLSDLWKLLPFIVIRIYKAFDCIRSFANSLLSCFAKSRKSREFRNKSNKSLVLITPIYRSRKSIFHFIFSLQD